MKSTVKKRIAIAVAAVFVLVCGLVYVVPDRIIFRNVDDPASREFLRDKPAYHEVGFTAENGTTYHGTMYQANDEKAPLIIYFGGNLNCSSRHMRSNEESGQWVYYAGYNYLYMDYEGYGQNGGRTSYSKMCRQALAVYDWAASLPNVDSECIVTIGYSLGTGCAVYLAANRPVAGVILAAPYANGCDLFNNVVPVFTGPMKLLVKQKLASDKWAPKVECPALVIASRSDEVVPFSSSARLVGLFPGNVDFLEVENAHHRGIFNVEGVFERVQSFLTEIKQTIADL
ncbi:MAG: alpha/beta hydrolase [Clostridiales bacterium]|nr:alpha/beta hydrolase [Clostridiales bacterium]